MAKSVLLFVLWVMVPFSASVSFAASDSYGVIKAASAKNPSLATVAAKSRNTTLSLTPGKAPLKEINLMVLGDSLGNGVWTGLYNAFRKDKHIKVMRKTKPSTGFVRLDYYDWNARLTQILTETRIDVAVVMIGANDRQTITTKSGRYRPGTKRWREIYASRLDVFIQQLKTHGAKVYMVGLPITRSKKFNRHMRILNEIFAERARANNTVFVDIWDEFTTANGGYSANGKDLKGRMRKLRANDGVHFTRRGYQKLSFVAERYIRADINKVVSPVTVVKLTKPQIKTEPEKIAAIAPDPGMMALEMIEDVVAPQSLTQQIPRPEKPEVTVIQPKFIPTPRFSPVGSDAEKVKSLQLALNAIARRVKQVPVNVRQQAQITPIQPEILPEFQPDADFPAKNTLKSEKNDSEKTNQQALDNVFQDILSIVQPDKAVVATSRAAIAPNQEVQTSNIKVLPLRQQMRKTVTLSSVLPGQSEKSDVVPRVAGIVRPVSIESGTPDDNVEYRRKTEYGRDAFTGTALASIAPLPELDFKATIDDKEVLDPTGYRTLLRGNAVPPKAGRGDDFSWPRD